MTPSNTELREAILKQFGAHLITGKWDIPPTEVADNIVALFQAREQQAIPKFSDMPEGNADFMEGFRVACLQMEANLNKTNDGAPKPHHHKEG